LIVKAPFIRLGIVVAEDTRVSDGEAVDVEPNILVQAGFHLLS
jgi:hypothetical protein